MFVGIVIVGKMLSEATVKVDKEGRILIPKKSEKVLTSEKEATLLLKQKEN